MNANIKLLVLGLLNLTIVSCQNFYKGEKQKIQKEYGNINHIDSSRSVELELSHYYGWRTLLEQTQRIACNDSLPKITLETDRERKTVYFNNPCWDHYACIFIKEKNTIKIHNDSIGKFHDELYPLDSLTSILKRDIGNNGKDSRLSDSPEKILIYLSYDKNRYENFPKTLDKLTQVYESITNKTDINIWLDQKLDTPPPPPPPLEKVDNH